MTSTIQPQSAAAQAASSTPSRCPEQVRLVELWTDLTRRTAMAAAHGSDDEESLRTLQLQVEDEITDRFPDGDALLVELWTWEASLIHVAQTRPETCLICRRARLGLPADLPLPGAAGGAR